MSNIQTKISLRVSAGAARNTVLGFTGDALQLKIAATPVKGKANKELIAFLSKLLGTSQSALTIIKGHTGRHKVITIDGLHQEEVLRRLNLEPSSSGDGATRRTRRQ